jgi:flagellar biosynthesis/type III secretory pathway ATPase
MGLEIVEGDDSDEDMADMARSAVEGGVVLVAETISLGAMLLGIRGDFQES